MLINHPLLRASAFIFSVFLLGCSPSDKVLSISEIAHNLGMHDSVIKEACSKNPNHQTCVNNNQVFILIEFYGLRSCYKNGRDSKCVEEILKKYSAKNPALKID